MMRSSLSETVRVCRVARVGEDREAQLLQWEKSQKRQIIHFVQND